MNGIVNEIEIQEREKPAAGEILNSICRRKHEINEIMSESEIPELRMLVAANFFFNICHSRTQIINEILNEIVIQVHEWWKYAAGEIC